MAKTSDNDMDKQCLERSQHILNAISSVPDFPKPGITFRDFFPIFESPQLTSDLLWLFEVSLKSVVKFNDVPVVVGVDSRGFLLGSLLAYKIKAPFVPLRKKGKIPPPTLSHEYNLEYGSDCLELSAKSVVVGKPCIIIDDLLATGGTMAAAEGLLKSVGAQVLACLVVIELPDLNGAQKVKAPLISIVKFNGD